MLCSKKNIAAAQKAVLLSEYHRENSEVSAYTNNPVFIALNKQFSEDAPKLKAFFDKNKMPIDVISTTLVEMEEPNSDPMDEAVWFLNKYPEVWTEWVTDDVAERIKQAL